MSGATGMSRRPERYGAKVDDARRDKLRKLLEAFEAKIGTDGAADDPEMAAALQEMRRETQELERLRGVWCVRVAVANPAPQSYFLIPSVSQLSQATDAT
jgi:hypothetical protein